MQDSARKPDDQIGFQTRNHTTYLVLKLADRIFQGPALTFNQTIALGRRRCNDQSPVLFTIRLPPLSTTEGFLGLGLLHGSSRNIQSRRKFSARTRAL